MTREKKLCIVCGLETRKQEICKYCRIPGVNSVSYSMTLRKQQTKYAKKHDENCRQILSARKDQLLKMSPEELINHVQTQEAEEIKEFNNNRRKVYK